MNCLPFVLSRCARALLPVCAGVLALAPAAQAADVVVASHGGVWERATQECFVKPYQEKTGKSAQVVLGTPAQWVNQIVANPAKPPIDLLLASPDGVIDAMNRGIVDALDPERLPVMKEMNPQLKSLERGYAAVVGFSSMGLAYNTETVKSPPKTWAEFVERTANGEWNAAIPSMRQASTPSVVLWMMAHTFGGGADNIEPAFETIAKMRSGGSMRVWNDMNEFLTLLKMQEIDIGMYWEGRAWAFHDEGNPEIAFVKPEPGVAIHTTLVQKVKNGSEAAWEFLNDYMLSAEGQSCFGNMVQYGVGNANVEYKPEIAGRITRMDEIVTPPYDEIAPHVREWVERWNKEVDR
ncbi:extracellular solute-binding protein [Verticiella sediminum]|uniref:Extracellular solute-binding protein n=1 Tax=Verticiella sediminum TaxID=1247510 RepID=A0A556ACE5_9BURK|nr:extracellular solute-binding protein [Verticiella sediminum]TSH90562.1 extracellular solute-binding protein [Verticiella sediminum]